MPSRLAVTVLAAAALLAAAGLYAPESRNPLLAARAEESAFYLQKTHRPDRHDILILGDSRALRGLAPQEMARALPGRDIFNFAYNAGGLNPEIYAAADRRLAATGPRAVVLGVTPLCLLDWKSANGQYREVLHAPRDQVFLALRAPAVAEFFEPVQPGDLIATLLDIPPRSNYRQHFYPDGWIASGKSPADTTEAPRDYRRTLAGSRVDPALVNDLAAQVRAWTDAGVRVFALRLPTTAAMVALEDSLLGFDQAALAARIEAAGGHWLDCPDPQYHSYDGSHLEADSARLLSRRVGEAMAGYLRRS
jgi:hypothetical protein